MTKSLFILLTALSLSTTAFAETNNGTSTVGQKVESGVEKTQNATKEAYEDTKKAANKASRGIKDKTCEMINGKLECAAKKVGNSLRNASDEVKDKVDDAAKK